jgi:hypothetical protein
MENKAPMVVCLLISTLLAGNPVQANPITPLPQLAVEHPDLSQVVLTLQDLPPGFEAMPSQLADLKTKLSQQENFKPESIFAFHKQDRPFQLVMGFTTLLPTRTDQVNFDSFLNQSGFVKPFLDGFQEASRAEVIEPKKLDLPTLGTIGNTSAGWQAVAKVQGIPIHLDIVLLRRGTVGVLTASMYLEGETPQIPIVEMAQKLDQRAKKISNLQEVVFGGQGRTLASIASSSL